MACWQSYRVLRERMKQVLNCFQLFHCFQTSTSTFCLRNVRGTAPGTWQCTWWTRRSRCWWHLCTWPTLWERGCAFLPACNLPPRPPASHHCHRSFTQNNSSSFWGGLANERTSRDREAPFIFAQMAKCPCRQGGGIQHIGEETQNAAHHPQFSRRR